MHVMFYRQLSSTDALHENSYLFIEHSMLTNNVFFPSLSSSQFFPRLSLSLSADDKGRRLNELSVDEGLLLMSTRLSALARHSKRLDHFRCSIFRSLF